MIKICYKILIFYFKNTHKYFISINIKKNVDHNKYSQKYKYKYRTYIYLSDKSKKK